MKDRIKLIMQSERLTTTRFAEILGIQPSAVSHLVSGRNKPGCDLIQRVLRQFPRVNPEWFILGVGSPYRDQTSYIEPESNELKLFNAPKTEDSEPPIETIENMGFSEAKAPETTIEPKQPNSAQPVRVMVFYDDGTCESYSLRG